MDQERESNAFGWMPRALLLELARRQARVILRLEHARMEAELELEAERRESARLRESLR